MPENHPSPEDIAGFLSPNSGLKATERNTRFIRHLLSGCSLCRTSLSDLGWPPERLDGLLRCTAPQDRPAERLAAVASWDYSRAFSKAEASVSGFLAEGRPPAQLGDSLNAELAALPPEERLRAVAEEPQFGHPALVSCLIEHSQGYRYQRPDETLHWTDLARRAAEACTVETTGSDLRLADIRGRAWGHYGNALRICGRILESSEALATAQSYAAAGTGDPVIRARLLEQFASLAVLQSDFQKAYELNEVAGEIYRELGETQWMARTRVQQAIARLASGEPESAVDLLNRAIPMIDFEDEPQLLLAACHNLIRCYIDLDRPEQALALYGEARGLYQEFEDEMIQLRATWQEGQLLRDLRHLRAAEQALVLARQGFLEHGLAFEAAVVCLDLSSVYVKLGLVEDVKATVAEAIPIFRALGVDREVLASLIRLQQVASEEKKALDLIRTLNTHLSAVSKRHPAH
jgi:tetratricopeptide (TPR) repeat protein